MALYPKKSINGLKNAMVLQHVKESLRNVLTYHSFGFAIYFILSRSRHTIELSTFVACLITWAGLSICVGLIQWTLTRYTQNSIKAGLQTTGIIIFILFFSNLQPLLESTF